jgi:hypothetical protein
MPLAPKALPGLLQEFALLPALDGRGWLRGALDPVFGCAALLNKVVRLVPRTPTNAQSS